MLARVQRAAASDRVLRYVGEVDVAAKKCRASLQVRSCWLGLECKFHQTRRNVVLRFWSIYAPLDVESESFKDMHLQSNEFWAAF